MKLRSVKLILINTTHIRSVINFYVAPKVIGRVCKVFQKDYVIEKTNYAWKWQLTPFERAVNLIRLTLRTPRNHHTEVPRFIPDHPNTNIDNNLRRVSFFEIAVVIGGSVGLLLAFFEIFIKKVLS